MGILDDLESDPDFVNLDANVDFICSLSRIQPEILLKNRNFVTRADFFDFKIQTNGFYIIIAHFRLHAIGQKISIYKKLNMF